MNMKQKLAEKLKLRTNPDYDHSLDPDVDQPAFWSPITATNDLVKLANAALDVAQAVNDAMARKTRVTIEHRQVRRQIEQLEKELIYADPLTPTEAKTVKLVEAAVYRRAEAAGRMDEYEALLTEQQGLEDIILECEAHIENGLMWNKVNQNVSENIKTALSFYKDEKRRAYQF